MTGDNNERTQPMSLYPKPGAVIDRIGADEVWTKAVVLGTSRHKITVSNDEAVRILAAHFELPAAALYEVESETWRRVTKADWDTVPDPYGTWHSEATGSGWVHVLWAEDPT